MRVFVNVAARQLDRTMSESEPANAPSNRRTVDILASPMGGCDSGVRRMDALTKLLEWIEVVVAVQERAHGCRGRPRTRQVVKPGGAVSRGVERFAEPHVPGRIVTLKISK